MAQAASATQGFDLICISHLRWDFVWQRPQQLLSRMAQQTAPHGRILFVEEPVTNGDCYGQHLHVYKGQGADNVTVVRLVQPAKEAEWIGHGDPRTQGAYETLLRGYLEQEGILNPHLWLYTPMAYPFKGAIAHHRLVYDVMDELAAFKGAPAELHTQGAALLKEADVVFTGGYSMYKAREGKNSNLHLFPSGVDEAHYARAYKESFNRPADLPQGGPIIGYFGVIDERMDTALLQAMAAQHPEWQLVIIGPVVKIDEADLPKAPNLHYLGQKAYADLPAYLAYFDVAIIPFAMTEATRYLSPTKTLEYMAARKPVVSAPLFDVIQLFGEVVRIGETQESFIQATEAALAESSAERKARQVKETALLTQYAWDTIAKEMLEQLMPAPLSAH